MPKSGKMNHKKSTNQMIKINTEKRNPKESQKQQKLKMLSRSMNKRASIGIGEVVTLR